jgi:uncharacterized protein YecE (DUF72 family)
MRVFTGTSGFSYDGWTGAFYPEDLPASERLAFYATKLPAVEINNTFYRMPKPELLAGWARQVPKTFRFALKAPQRITHIKRLKETVEEVRFLTGSARQLGENRGPILFGIPPNLKKDVPRLRAFLEKASPESRALRFAFEFRHASWFDDEVWAVLRAHGASLCVAEGETLESPLVATADWGYVRLRRDAYPDDVLATWAAKILAQPWKDAFVYLKHDDGDAPSVAARLVAHLGRLGT